MTIDRRRVAPGVAAVLAAGLMTTMAPAQDAQRTPAQDAPRTPAQNTPRPLQGLENFSLPPTTPSPTPSPSPTAVPVPATPTIVLPTPSPTPTPAPTARAKAVAPERAAPESSPTPATPPEAKPTPSPTPEPTPVASLTPVAPAPPPAISPSPVPSATTPAPSSDGAPVWPWLAGAATIALLGIGIVVARRRKATVVDEHEDIVPVEPVAPDPVPEPAAPRFLEARPVVAAPVSDADAPRARLTIELRPKRAGLNLLSATAECEIVVTNTGDAPASGIRAQATLLTAHAGQDADLAAINAAPIVRPAVPPFALAPGESRSVRTVAATPREAIHSLMAGDRPMFVPIVAVNILYDSGDLRGQTAGAWAIGVERVDSAKLAPFWLDGPARMFDAIGARAHAAAVER